MTDDTSSTDGAQLAKHFGIRSVGFLVMAGLIFWFRPLFHWLFYRVAYSPFMLVTVGGAMLALTILWFAPPLSDDMAVAVEKKARIFGYAFVGLILIGGVLGAAGGMYEQRTLADQTMEDSYQVEDFPEVNEENARIAPRGVSDTQAQASVSYRQYELGASDIARMEDGSLAWTYPIQPDPFRVQLTGHQQGVLMYDMTAMEDRELQAIDDHQFETGEGMLFQRGTGGFTNWNLVTGDYWAQYNDDPVEFTHDGTPYMYYPKSGHEWHLTPVPHTTPTWDGGALVHPDGTIEHLTPEEAQDHEILEGQRLYPLDVTESQMDSLGYRNGIVNQLPGVGGFEGVVEVADIPSDAGNSQPFVIDLEDEEMSYVMAMEPHGDDTSGLDEVWFTNAETGEMQYYASENETLTGPSNALGIARGADTRTDWGADGDARMLEPVPMIVDGDLWWHMKVTTVDQTDVVRNVFVNADTDEAVEIHDTEAVYEFIEGEDLDDLDEAEEVDTEEAPEDDSVAYYIIIEDGNGNEVDRIPVDEGQETSIVSDEDEQE